MSIFESDPRLHQASTTQRPSCLRRVVRAVSYSTLFGHLFPIQNRDLLATAGCDRCDYVVMNVSGYCDVRSCSLRNGDQLLQDIVVNRILKDEIAAILHNHFHHVI